MEITPRASAWAQEVEMPITLKLAGKGQQPDNIRRQSDAGDGVLRDLAIAHAGIGVWNLSATSDELICDDISARLLGRSDLHTGAGLLAAVHPGERERLAIRLQLCVRAGTEFNASLRISGGDGESRWLQITARRVEQADGEFVVVGTLRDNTEQQGIEDALRQSENRLKTVFDQTAVGLLHRDRDFNLLMVNERYLELVGRTAEEMDRLPLEAFTHLDDLAQYRTLMMEKRSTGEPFSVETRYVRPDGSEVWCEIHVSFIPDPDGGWSSSLVFAHDITDRKAAEDENKRSREMLALALDGAGVGTWETDATNRNLLRLSANALEMYGLPRDHCGTLATEEWAKFIHPECVETLAVQLEQFARSKRPNSAEFKILRADGEERWLRIRGRTMFDEEDKPVGSIGLVYDDSERKQAEIELKENESRLRLIQEAARIGTFVTEPKGNTTGSRQFFRNLGLPEDTEWIDEDTRWKQLHPDDRDHVLSQIDEAVRARKEFHEVEYRIIRADTGETRWILTRIRPETDENGNLLRLVGAHIDITDAKTSALKLRETESLNRAIVDSSPDCIKIMNADGRLSFMSERGLEAMEIDDAGTVLGKKYECLWPVEARKKVKEALATARAGQMCRFNAGGLTNKGRPKWWDVIMTPLSDEGGSITQLLSISRDVTDLREQSEKLRWTAEHDALTKLPNRNFFDQRMAELLPEAETHEEHIGLLALDVDSFKQVNDAFGHDAGDALLKTLASRIRDLLDEGDFAARLGGDEFAIVLRHLETGRDLMEIGEAVSATMKQPIAYQGYILDCRVSIGAAMSPVHGTTPDLLLKSADTALYAAKTGSRKKEVLLFERSFRSELDRRTAMIARARSAIAAHNVMPFYQPKIDLHSGHVVGFEALLRWRDAGGDIRLPAEIEAAFEDHELAHQISERMQDRVLADMRRWLDREVRFGHVAINASAAEFSRNDFAFRLLDMIDAAGVLPGSLQVEVTETVFLGRGAEHVGADLRRLKERGIQIALDDFGTGYASLSHLKKFPVDVIKIDKSFTLGLGEDAGDTAIVCSLINLASDLQIGIVAEGIETWAQADYLRERGCQIGQGYLFGKAVHADQVPALLGRPLFELRPH